MLGAEIDADNFGVQLLAEGVIEMINRSFLGQNNIVFGDTVLNNDNKFRAQRKLRLLIQKADVVVYINGGDGFTDNYVKVKTPYDATLVNQLRKVQLKELDADGSVLVDVLMEELVS